MKDALSRFASYRCLGWLQGHTRRCVVELAAQWPRSSLRSLRWLGAADRAGSH